MLREQTMSGKDLRELLHAVDDTRELVLPPPERGDEWRLDELYLAWTAARDDARDAYEAWRLRHGADAYAVYVAAEDRADAALQALVAES
jgi:hypothetical protein